MWAPGSAGIVARDGRGIAGFALITRRPYGVVADEFWVDDGPRGLRASAAIITWLEENGGGQVGGIVREDSPLYAVLRKRGYTVSAHVLTKAVA